MGPVAARLSHGRIHLQHGPIDLVIHADGDSAVVDRAHACAWRRFQEILPELVTELPLLRRGMDPSNACELSGPISRRMWSACLPYASEFITPMAAVAGAVSDEIIAFYRTEGIDRATVNNGGDIALHLLAGQSIRVALVPDLSDPGAVHDAQRRLPLQISSDTTIRGVATSGWPGRSFSLGIADSVTILAATCSEADAAATFVANAVNCGHPSIVRRPASESQPDSDLGDRLVTVAVPPLPAEWIDFALDAGALEADQLIREARISGAILVCQGRVRRLGSHGGNTDEPGGIQ